ncbi:complex 1 LYR family protein [Nitzschia inconspicua]|uniref:Complex 1 LYR family protein n=1 Tax=Nitzschia inconspicua TaxID=303405 RepID=A0A9K3PNS3_9STRA|nr:complex 1 LYR family protein [Nitzschia inconspicua]
MGVINNPAVLYKKIMKELPRVLMIYDIDMPLEDAKSSIRSRFYDQKDVKDPRVIEMLVETGYFSLETSMLQHKQKNHLMHFLEGYTVPMEAERKRLMSPDAPIEQQFARN